MCRRFVAGGACANTDVNDVIIGNEMLGKVGKCSSPEQVRNKEFKPLGRIPL
jgi:hypothetical protein